MRSQTCLITSALLTLSVWALALPTVAQPPRIQALFPAGAKAGETVKVSVLGGGLTGAKNTIVTGQPGVNAELVGGAAAVDEKAKPLFQAKCTSCHEARSPQNRTMNPDQWAATVDRMINQRGADINKTDRDAVVGYLQALARAGEVSLQVSVAKDAAPGMREIRVMTDHGVSTAYLFEIGTFPEVTAAEPNSTLKEPQKVSTPVVINGTLNTAAARDYFAFEAKKGQRLAFNLKGFRLNEFAQTFFNPALYLYDSGGRPVAKNLGKFGLDPALEWTAPADGTYIALVRDLLWKGSPASVYRLAIGPIIAEGLLSPSAARPGASVSAHLIASAGGMESPAFDVRIPDGIDGITTVSTPMGDAPLLVRDLPDRGGPSEPSAAPASLPGVFRGVISAPGRIDSFKVTATTSQGGLEVYARRLGSPLRARVTIKNAKGQTLQIRDAQGTEDLRIPNPFPGPGEYVVEIGDAEGRGGPTFSYCWEALDGAPDFTLTAAPDGLNIPPGGAIPVLVRAVRRENLKGAITLSVPDLPPGVTASKTVIPPDDDKAILVLSAAPGAALDSRVVSILGTAPGDKGVVAVRRARPLEILRINGQQRLLERGAQIAATLGDPAPFTLEVVQGNRIVLEAGKEVKLTIRVKRQPGFNLDVVVGQIGLPPGIGINTFINIPRDKTEGEIIIRADGNARFLKERPLPDLPPMEMVLVGFQAGGDGTPLACTAPLTLVGQ